MTEFQERVTLPVHVPCNCTGCGGEHHAREMSCPSFANSYDGKCEQCNAQLDRIATAVAS